MHEVSSVIMVDKNTSTDSVWLVFDQMKKKHDNIKSELDQKEYQFQTTINEKKGKNLNWKR